MADPYVRQARGVFTGTGGSTALIPGDAVYFDGTDWEKADATDNTKYAEAIVAVGGNSGDVVSLCRSCIIVDIDAPYTQGDQYYLSEAAGALTATYILGSVTAESLVQLLGFALSTSELYVDIPPLRFETITLQFAYTEGGTVAQDFDGDFHGVLLAEAADAAAAAGQWPRNIVGAVEEALLWWCGTGTALDASDTYTIDVSAGIDDETTSTTYDGITAAALTVAAQDLAVADVTAAFDEAGLVKPGNVFAVDVNKAAQGDAGDDPIMLCISIGILTC